MRKPPDRPYPSSTAIVGSADGESDQVEKGRNQQILSVSEFSGDVRRLLEDHYPMVWIQGELSNVRRPGSGHWYFTLKDSDAQLRCAMFRGRNRLVRFAPEDGLEVIARGKVSLYEGRGDFQVIVENLRPAGDGALRLAMEQLRARLGDEGLLDAARKRPLPQLPLCIALVTSPTGAALQDMLAVLSTRYRIARVVLVPALVQGKDAPESIRAGLAQASAIPDVDLIVCGRGGGSLEDLAAFNSEVVARSIAASSIPIISAVGHETDITIADLVADARAPTPSAAIEQAVPDQRALLAGFDRIATTMRTNVQQQLRDADRELRTARKRLRSQAPRSGHAARQTASARARLEQAMRQCLLRWQAAVRQQRLQHPGLQVRQLRQRLDASTARLHRSARTLIVERRVVLGSAARAMHAVSPMSTLERGYSIVATGDDPQRLGQPLLDARDVARGDALRVQLARGRLNVRVEERILADPDGSKESGPAQ